MSIDDLIDTIEGKLDSLEKDEFIELWNVVFPPEEHVSSISDNETADMKEMLQEEISMADTKKILKAYNKITGEELTIEDMDSDEEGWEPDEEEEDDA